LLWWTGHLFFFSAWMLVGYGVLEGHRVFEREELITRLAELTGLLEEQSVRDPLTAIFNRRHAMAILEMEFKKAQRGSSPLTLLVGDLDDFKLINDTYGHLVGDQVLRETARRLGESVRESDVVARCGGEEFWIILPLTNRMGGREVATKTVEALRNRPFETESDALKVTMSMGVADTFSPSVTDVASLIREADRALYAAKRAGKDRVAILDPLTFTVPAK
jgi:two-component system cell cycle response regulator